MLSEFIKEKYMIFSVIYSLSKEKYLDSFSKNFESVDNDFQIAGRKLNECKMHSKPCSA